MIHLPRVCPSCSYEDDDPYTSLEPRCPMCNIDFKEALLDSERKKEKELAERQVEEERQLQIRKEESDWRQRRSVTEASNAKNFDPSFIAQARRKSQTAASEAHRREEEAAANRKLLEAQSAAAATALSEKREAEKNKMMEMKKMNDTTSAPPSPPLPPPPSLPVTSISPPFQSKPLVIDPITTATTSHFAKHIPTATESAVTSPAALLQLLSTLPRTPLTVFITGMPGVPVGRTTLKQVLQQSLDYLQLSAYVTLVDDPDQQPPNFVAESQSPHSRTNTLVLSVYDICHEKSFEYCVQQQQKGKVAGGRGRGGRGGGGGVVFPTLLVGNKADLEYWRKVTVQKAASAVQDINTATADSATIAVVAAAVAKLTVADTGAVGRTSSSNSNSNIVPPAGFFEVSAVTGLHIGHLMDAILRLLFAPHFTLDFVRRLLEVTGHDDQDDDHDEEEDMQALEAASRDPQMKAYMRLLRVGVAAEAVFLKMKAEGVRTRVLLSRFPRVEFVPSEHEHESDHSSSGGSSLGSYSDSDSSLYSSDGDASEDRWNEISKPKPRRRKSHGSLLDGISAGKSLKKSKEKKSEKDKDIHVTDFLLDSISTRKPMKKSKTKWGSSENKKAADVRPSPPARLDMDRIERRGGGGDGGGRGGMERGGRGGRGGEAKGMKRSRAGPPRNYPPLPPSVNMVTEEEQEQEQEVIHHSALDEFAFIPPAQQPPRQQQPPPLPPSAPSGAPPSSSSSSSSSAVSGGLVLPTLTPTEDNDLDSLFESLQELKSISSSISKELEQQHELLADINEQVDEAPLDSGVSMILEGRRGMICNNDDDDDDDDDEDWEENEQKEMLDESAYDIEEEEDEYEEREKKDGYDDIDDEICVDVGDTSLASVQGQISEVKNIMHMNIDMQLERGEKLDSICAAAEDLQMQAGVFKRSSSTLKKRLQRRARIRRLCCCCILCAYGANGCFDICKSCAHSSSSCLSKCTASLKKALRNLMPKKSLMDNVLADTENAFQTLAKALTFLIGNNDTFRCCGVVYYYMFGVWHQLLAWILSYVLIVSSTVVMILPSFFTLLIVRTSTIEKESKSFGVRQETIRHEKKEQSALRWLRIILRSLPMSGYLLVLPYFLVYRVFPSRTNDQITYMLVGYLLGVIILQILGSVRVYYSWKTRDITAIPTAPDMYYLEPVKPHKTGASAVLSKLTCCRSSSSPSSSDKSFVALENVDDEGQGGAYTEDKSKSKSKSKKEGAGAGDSSQVKKKTPAPIPPNTFKTSAANIMVLLSLTLEFFQMASFALQTNPLEGASDSDSDSQGGQDSAPSVPTAAPSMAVEDEDDFWGAQLFDRVYVHLAVDSDWTLAFMWAAVGVVGLLILVFANQFLFELKLYGSLLRRIEDKDKAKDSFFFSFTGCIVYGHGKPRHISKRMRLVVSVLSDVLFLVISMQLLSVLACDPVSDTDTDTATLRAKESVVCWEGEHALLATLSLMAYAFYVPLSIMITPMLLEGPSSEDQAEAEKPKDDGVAFLKLYLMTINVVKSVMLVVAVLGPQSISALVLATTLSSLLLGGITIAWYTHSSKQDSSISAPYSAHIHPCNVAFINYWKAASYSTSVISALVVVTFHLLEDSSAFVSERSLTDTLITCWLGIVFVYIALYYRHHQRVKPRRQLVADLIAYPFQWRDMREAAELEGGAEGVSWCSRDPSLERRRHIPGFVVSPWQDHVQSQSQSAPAPVSWSSGGGGADDSLSYRLLQHFHRHRGSPQ